MPISTALVMHALDDRSVLVVAVVVVVVVADGNGNVYVNVVDWMCVVQELSLSYGVIE